MHDPLRDACWGVAVTCSGTTAFLDSDSIHISNLPEKLLLVSYKPLPLHALRALIFTFICPFGLHYSEVWLCSCPPASFLALKDAALTWLLVGQPAQHD